MKLIRLHHVALLAGVSLAAMSQGAFAQDAADFTAKIKAAYDTFGYDFEFGPATSDDAGTITIEGVTVSLTTMPQPTEPLTIPTTLTFSGVEQMDDGGYIVEELTVPDVDVVVDDAHITVHNISFRQLFVPGGDNPTMVDAMQLLGQLSAGPMALEVEGKTFITIASVAAENVFTPGVGQGPLESMTSVATVDGIVADLSIIPDAEAQAVIAALGLETITGSMREDVSWTMGDGHLDVSEFSFTLDDLGKINLTFDLVGYTAELLQSMSDSQKQMMDLATAGDTAALQKAQEAFGLQMASQLSLGGIGIRYDDASLAGKMLEFFAAQQGLSAADLAGALKTMAAAQIPPMLGEPLTGQIKDAVNAFLDDPQSFEVAVAPADPVNFMMLAMLAAQPQAMLPMLNVSVTANQGGAPEEDEGTAEEEAAPADSSTPMDASPAEEPAKEKIGN